jgi:hypothetical protein
MTNHIAPQPNLQHLDLLISQGRQVLFVHLMIGMIALHHFVGALFQGDFVEGLIMFQRPHLAGGGGYHGADSFTVLAALVDCGEDEENGGGDCRPEGPSVGS